MHTLPEDVRGEFGQGLYLASQAIAETIERRGLTRDEAARIMGLDQPRVSAIVRGRLSGFTQDRLTRCVLPLAMT